MPRRRRVDNDSVEIMPASDGEGHDEQATVSTTNRLKINAACVHPVVPSVCPPPLETGCVERVRAVGQAREKENRAW